MTFWRIRKAKGGERRTVEVVLGAEDVGVEEVAELRRTAGVEAEVWDRPAVWERMFQCYLHPSSAEYIEQLEAALHALEDELADTKALLTKQLMNGRELGSAMKDLLAEEAALIRVMDDPELKRKVDKDGDGNITRDELEAAGQLDEIKFKTAIPIAVIDDDGMTVGQGELGDDDESQDQVPELGKKSKKPEEFGEALDQLKEELNQILHI